MRSILRYELDDYGKVGITLEEFDSLEEMDKFMKRFSDSNDVKDTYLERINKFLKTENATKFLKSITKENNGYLRGYSSDGYQLRHIPLIYQSSLLPEGKCYTQLREKLQERSVLYDIYNRKYFVLPKNPTRFLKDELAYCVKHHGTNRIFIKEFIIYIKSLKPEERYFVLRVLCDKCHLLDMPKKKGINFYKIRYDYLKKIGTGYELVRTHPYSFGDFTDEEVHEMIPEDVEVSTRDGADTEFESIVQDIEKLLEEYDIEEIDKNTDYFDKMKRKGR